MFFVAQVLGLLDGRELYTKAALSQAFPLAEPALARKAGASVNPVLRALVARLEHEGLQFFQHSGLVLCKMHCEVSLCSFEKNRARFVGFVPANAAYISYAGSIVVGLTPSVSWKPRVKLPKLSGEVFCAYDCNLEIIRE